MVIAVIPYPGHSFDQMFAMWSPFYKEGICQNWTFLLKKSCASLRVYFVPFQKEKTKEYDAVLHCSVICKDALREAPAIKHIYYAGEPSIVCVRHGKKYIPVLARYVYDGILTSYSDIDFANCYSVTVPHDFPQRLLEETVPWNQKKLACMFSGNKFALGKTEMYTERRRVIEWFEKNASNEFDFYGQGWTAPYNRFKVYKGISKDALETGQRYKFTICFDNERYQNGCVSERIADAMLTETVPVYDGANDIRKLVPENCFIDYRKFKSIKECVDYLKNMSEGEYQTYRNNIKKYISSAHQKGLFSAEKMRDQLICACEDCDVKEKRILWVLDAFRLQQRVYTLFCRVRKKVDMLITTVKVRAWK